MNNENRVSQIASTFNSFTKSTYTKEERLSELLNIQKEMAAMTLSVKTDAELDNARLWDVVKHFEQENAEYGGKATSEVTAFRKDCSKIGQMIAAEISGLSGENRAYWRLVNAECPGIILRNLEISNDEDKSELDLVVINASGVFIVEVKNTHKDVFIDEDGDQYKMGAYTKFDTHLGDKMAFRKQLLQEHLAKLGFSNVDVTGLVVYTFNRIEVQNRCPELKTCFLGQLPYLIKEHRGKTAISDEEQATIASAFEQAAQNGSYAMDYDMEQFKENFANALLAIENAKLAPKTIKERMEAWMANSLGGLFKQQHSTATAA